MPFLQVADNQYLNVKWKNRLIHNETAFVPC